jgi:hypothetical protein
VHHRAFYIGASPALPATGRASRNKSGLRIGATGSWEIVTPTPGVDGADNGLSAFVDMYVLNSHLLLAFAAVAIERVEHIAPRRLDGS